MNKIGMYWIEIYRAKDKKTKSLEKPQGLYELDDNDTTLIKKALNIKPMKKQQIHFRHHILN